MSMGKEKKPLAGLLKRVIDWWDYIPGNQDEIYKAERKYLVIAIALTIINALMLLVNVIDLAR